MTEQTANVDVVFYFSVKMLVQSNSAQSDRIRVLKGEVDEVVCPEAVDIIISDPMGYMLLADRLLEKVLFTKKWLKPNGTNIGSNRTGII